MTVGFVTIPPRYSHAIKPRKHANKKKKRVLFVGVTVQPSVSVLQPPVVQSEQVGVSREAN